LLVEELCVGVIVPYNYVVVVALVVAIVVVVWLHVVYLLFRQLIPPNGGPLCGMLFISPQPSHKMFHSGRVFLPHYEMIFRARIAVPILADG
jgi:hypothetical protein